VEKKKPKWGKPKLLVLTKGKPEENVLWACKWVYNDGGANRTNSGCYSSWGGCPVCSIIAAS